MHIDLAYPLTFQTSEGFPYSLTCNANGDARRSWEKEADDYLGPELASSVSAPHLKQELIKRNPQGLDAVDDMLRERTGYMTNDGIWQSNLLLPPSGTKSYANSRFYEHFGQETEWEYERAETACKRIEAYEKWRSLGARVASHFWMTLAMSEHAPLMRQGDSEDESMMPTLPQQWMDGAFGRRITHVRRQDALTLWRRAGSIVRQSRAFVRPATPLNRKAQRVYTRREGLPTPIEYSTVHFDRAHHTNARRAQLALKSLTRRPNCYDTYNQFQDSISELTRSRHRLNAPMEQSAQLYADNVWGVEPARLREVVDDHRRHGASSTGAPAVPIGRGIEFMEVRHAHREQKIKKLNATLPGMRQIGRVENVTVHRMLPDSHFALGSFHFAGDSGNWRDKDVQWKYYKTVGYADRIQADNAAKFAEEEAARAAIVAAAAEEEDEEVVDDWAEGGAKHQLLFGGEDDDKLMRRLAAGGVLEEDIEDEKWIFDASTVDELATADVQGDSAAEDRAASGPIGDVAGGAVDGGGVNVSGPPGSATGANSPSGSSPSNGGLYGDLGAVAAPTRRSFPRGSTFGTWGTVSKGTRGHAELAWLDGSVWRARKFGPRPADSRDYFDTSECLRAAFQSDWEYTSGGSFLRSGGQGRAFGRSPDSGASTGATAVNAKAIEKIRMVLEIWYPAIIRAHAYYGCIGADVTDNINGIPSGGYAQLISDAKLDIDAAGPTATHARTRGEDGWDLLWVGVSHTKPPHVPWLFSPTKRPFLTARARRTLPRRSTSQRKASVNNHGTLEYGLRVANTWNGSSVLRRIRRTSKRWRTRSRCSAKSLSRSYNCTRNLR